MPSEKEIRLTQQLMAHFEEQGISRRTFLRMLGIAGGGTALSALLAACGGTSADVPTSVAEPTATATPAVEATTASSPVATSGSTARLVIASGQDISNLDPHTGHDYSIASAQKAVYDTLLRYKGNPPEVEPLLATEYSTNDDASVWTFKLAPNAVFHDGSPVTATDVVYSAERMLRKNKGASWMFTGILKEGSVVADDDQTVTFNLTTPFAPLPLVLPWLFIVNEEVVKAHEADGDEGEGWLVENEAGSGPFTIASWRVGDAYEFTAVDNYWAGWNPEGHLPGFIWKISRESSSSRLGLLNGDYQMVVDLSVEDAQAMKSDSNFFVNDEPGLSAYAIKLNNQHGPCADIHVRKAISYAMDYDALIDLTSGRGTLMVGPLPGMGDYNDPDLVPYRFDVEKAKAELAQSAYPEGGFEIEYVHVTGLQTQEQIGLVLLDKLAQLNITVKITPLVWPDMVARASSPETSPDMMIVSTGMRYSDPDNFFWLSYHSSRLGSANAASQYSNPEVDTLLEEGRATADQAKRVEIYRKVQQILVNDAVEVWLYNEPAQLTLSTKVGGFDYCPILGYYIQPLYLKA